MDQIESIALSKNVTGEVRAKLLSLIPEAFTEGKLDIAALQRALGQENVVEVGERFALTWAGKGDAYKDLQAPTSATLRPQRDLSVHFDTGLHTFIEGENLEVLKVLQKSYFAAVSFIYIDPPYNTGSDSFIYPDRFSHSALREGWDNPNVFQICTLAESNSEVKKRQEIGRGLRIAVDSNGNRVVDPNINRLTIIANDSYEDFARDLQTEMEEQGVAFKKEMAPNARKMVKITLKKGYEADSNFLQLWERIRQQTRYRVRYSTEELIAAAILGVHAMPKIERPKMIIARADLAITGAGITTIETGRKTQELDAKYVIPDLIAQIQARTSLSKTTVAAILLGSGRLDDAIKNPQAYIEHTAASINTTKRELLVRGVEYVKIDGMTYEMQRFEDDNLAEVFESNVIAVQKQEKTLFSHIIIDSGSQPEQNFAKACDANDDVYFYIKLPRWFEIETPVGAYHPDWALMYNNQKILYFVAETKGSGGANGVDLALLRPLEKLKIDCGYKHFEQFEEVAFKAVETLAELVA